MPLDLTQPGRSNPEVHFRRYLSDDRIKTVCVQNFDYYGYDTTRFVDEATFPTEADADNAPILTWPLVRIAETDPDPRTRQQAIRNLEAIRRHTRQY